MGSRQQGQPNPAAGGAGTKGGAGTPPAPSGPYMGRGDFQRQAGMIPGGPASAPPPGAKGSGNPPPPARPGGGLMNSGGGTKGGGVPPRPASPGMINSGGGTKGGGNPPNPITQRTSPGPGSETIDPATGIGMAQARPRPMNARSQQLRQAALLRGRPVY